MTPADHAATVPELLAKILDGIADGPDTDPYHLGFRHMDAQEAAKNLADRATELETALRLADALADRFEAMDTRAHDFGRANELVAYRDARAALGETAPYVPCEHRYPEGDEVGETAT